MTTSTLTNHVSETQLTTSAATLFSTAANEKKYIGKFTVTNTSANTVTVTLWRIASATVATTGSGGNWIFNQPIAAGEERVITILQGHMLDNSMKIAGSADTASVVNVDASGTTII